MGFERDGAYSVEGRRGGDVWIDGSGMTMIAIDAAVDRVTASAHTLLDDGTHVITEDRALPFTKRVVEPTAALTIEQTSVRRPDEAWDMRQLLEQHRSHVEDVERARGAKARTGGSVAAFVAAKNTEEVRREPMRALLANVGLVLGGLGAAGCVLVGVLQWMHGRPWNEWPSMAPFIGLLYFFMGRSLLGPNLVRRGNLAPAAARSVDLERAQDGGLVTSIRARAPWLFAVIWAVLAGGVVGASVKGAASLATLFLGFALSGLGEHVAAALRDRTGRAKRRVTWEIAGDQLRVEGERPLALTEITAAIRSDVGMPTLLVLDRHGRVALRLTGSAESLDEIRDAIGIERMKLPTARDLGVLAALLVPPLAALVVAFGIPVLAVKAYTLASILVAAWPLLHLRRRTTVEVGVDGLVIEGRFVAFADIASLDTYGERLDCVEASGKRTSVTLAHPGSAAEIARRWKEHVARANERDEEHVVRRRVAIEDESDVVPYRARIASPEELGEALLDSAEERQVRVRAAQRLARDDGEEAARIREEIEDQLVDPDVRNELRRSDD
jgi:hypothetical protein